MKIISIGSDRDLFREGSEVRKRQLIFAQKHKRVEIIVFALRKLGLAAADLSPVLRIIPTNSRSRWLYIFDAIRIGRALSAADLITAQDPFESGLAAWRIAKLTGAKLELQIHTDFMNPYFAKQSFLNVLRVFIARRLLPRADYIRTVSQRIKDSLSLGDWRLKSEPTVQPVNVDLEKFKNAPVVHDLHKKYPRFDKIILMASRLTWEKNISLAIQAMAEVIKSCPLAGLVVVGSGPLEAELKRKVKSLRLSDSVVFEDWTDDLPAYYKSADLFLLTSFYEGYGRTILEARAAGCPVVSTDVGVAREAGAIIASVSDLAQVILNQFNKP